MTNKDNKEQTKKAPNEGNPGQPAPLSGSHKVKNRNHSRQKKNSGHDM